MLTQLALAAQEGAPASPGGGLMDLLPMLALMFVALWFIVLRPEQKQRKERQRQLEALKKGDRVITAGGIHGKVTDVDRNAQVAKVEVAPKIQMKFNIASITKVEAKDGPAEAEPQGEKDEAKAGK